MALRIGMPPTSEPLEEEIPIEEEMPVEEPSEEAMPDMMAGGTVAPEAARYMTPDMRCNSCIHYMEPGSCEIVAGPIDPEGVCMIYTADDLGEELPVEEPLEEPALEEPIEE